jgi:hypothetical protein
MNDVLENHAKGVRIQVEEQAPEVLRHEPDCSGVA